jgi:hypothetical protein
MEGAMAQLLNSRESEDIGVVVPVMIDLDKLEVTPSRRRKRSRASIWAYSRQHIATFDRAEALAVQLHKVEVCGVRELEGQVRKLLCRIDDPTRLR